jgi:hypothetical protein
MDESDGIVDLDHALRLLRAGTDALAALAAAGALQDVPAARLTAGQSEPRSLAGRQTAVRLTALPGLEVDGSWALDGSRSFAAWLARHDDVPRGAAHREVRQARALRDELPATRSAALKGTIGLDHVAAMVAACTTEARAAALSDPVSGLPPRFDAQGAELPAPTGEEFLLEQAGLHRLPAFQRLTQRFAHVADPDADDRGYRDAAEREFFELGLMLGGFHVRGFLTEEHGAALRVALDARMGVPAADDERTVTQRRAQAVADLARIILDNGLAGSGSSVRPHLNVTVSWAELKRLLLGAQTDHTLRGPGADLGGIDVRGLLGRDGAPAILEGSTGPLPDTLLRKLACDSELTRIVFGPDGQVLNVGRAQRTVTGQLRRAVIARDRHCTYPGCHEPPSRCEVHHAERHWAEHGGETAAADSALLCWHHHSLVDTTGVTMRWSAPEAGWRFIDRHGRSLAA